MLKDNENGQTVQKIILLYLIMPNSPFSDIHITLTFFISNRFIQRNPSCNNNKLKVNQFLLELPLLCNNIFLLREKPSQKLRK